MSLPSDSNSHTVYYVIIGILTLLLICAIVLYFMKKPATSTNTNTNSCLNCANDPNVSCSTGGCDCSPSSPPSPPPSSSCACPSCGANYIDPKSCKILINHEPLKPVCPVTKIRLPEYVCDSLFIISKFSIPLYPSSIIHLNPSYLLTNP